MQGRLQHITIVGGGTSGWMTAAFLVTSLNRAADRAAVRITLIESPTIPTVGVGEATVPGMPRSLRQLGLDETEFFRRTNASFKLGVRFTDWNRDAEGRAMSYIHPFNGGSYIDGWNPAYYYQAFGRGANPDCTDALIPNPSVIAAGKGPKTIGGKSFESAIGYAYHLDARLFADVLRDFATARGVEHVLDDIDDVELDERGYVAAVSLRQGGRHPIDFVIDCSGFRGLIIKDALGEPFESFDRYLLNDRALAVQIPHQDARMIEPCTRSTALGAGWAWRVPLYNRVGTGYVFSSKFRSDDQAMTEFMAHLGPQAAGYEPRAIAMRVGRSRRSWVKNCLAIGLSGGFIEPLESTAIFMVEMAIRWFLTYLPDQSHPPALSDKYNNLMESLYAEIRDFIVLHYYLGNREEPYWRAAREEIELPDTLAANLDLWKSVLPNINDPTTTFLFNNWSYIFVLFGKGYFAGRKFTLQDTLREQEWRGYQDRLAGVKANLLRELPDHYALLQALRGEAGPAAMTGAFPHAPAGTFPGMAGPGTIPVPDQTPPSVL